jgi:hypothetical protein
MPATVLMCSFGVSWWLFLTPFQDITQSKKGRYGNVQYQ